jgi:hypothetical protein
VDMGSRSVPSTPKIIPAARKSPHTITTNKVWESLGYKVN